MIILGIDPGTAICGYGFIEYVEGQLTVFRLFVLDHMTGVITMLLMCSASLCLKEYSVVAAVVAEFMLPCLHCSDLFVYQIVVVEPCFFDVKINAFYAPAARP